MRKDCFTLKNIHSLMVEPCGTRILSAKHWQANIYHTIAFWAASFPLKLAMLCLRHTWQNSASPLALGCQSLNPPHQKGFKNECNAYGQTEAVSDPFIRWTWPGWGLCRIWITFRV
jgi:hypothetical protein